MAKKKVLVIDDDSDFVYIVRQRLEANNYEVRGLEDAKGIIASVHDFRPDVILLDLLMPGIGGMDTCEMLNKDTVGADIPIIVVSGLSGIADKTEAYKLGVVGYLVKPIESRDLTAAIEKAIAAKAGEEGQVLMEAVVAVAILALVWVAAVNVIIVSKASGSLGKHKTQAAYVIQRTIEDLRKKPFSSLASGVSTVTIDTKGTPDNCSDDLTGTQVVTITNADPYYKKVLVQLSWNELLFGKSRTATEYCGTYIANDSQIN